MRQEAQAKQDEILKLIQQEKDLRNTLVAIHDEIKAYSCFTTAQEEELRALGILKNNQHEMVLTKAKIEDLNLLIKEHNEAAGDAEQLKKIEENIETLSAMSNELETQELSRKEYSMTKEDVEVAEVRNCWNNVSNLITT